MYALNLDSDKRILSACTVLSIGNYGTLYKSLIDGNVWSPEAYPAGWEKVN